MRRGLFIFAVAAVLIPTVLVGLLLAITPNPDVNDDGVVSAVDLAIVGKCYGKNPTSTPGCASADINADGAVTSTDLSLVTSSMRQTFPIKWTPSEIVVTLSPGETKTIDVTSTIRKSIQATTATLSPSLQSFVSVAPSGLPALSTGSQRTFQLRVSVPSTAALGTIDATLHLRSGTTTLARPLPITLNIWPTSQVQDSGAPFTFKYPAGWVVTQLGSEASFDDPAVSRSVTSSCGLTDPPCNGEDPPELTVSIRSNPTALPLIAFLSTIQDGWFLQYAELNSLLASGLDTLLVSDLTSPTPSIPILAAFIRVSNTDVLVITARKAQYAADLLQLLNSLQVP